MKEIIEQYGSSILAILTFVVMVSIFLAFLLGSLMQYIKLVM